MQLIGLSLSFCIADILAGKVKEEDVRFISTGTRCHTVVDWRGLVEEYRIIYWRADPARAEEIMWRLIDGGRIIQPRLEGKRPVASGGRGTWCTVEQYNDLAREVAVHA